ncbi:MAG: LacI family DNA-binding transcriptional regulator [Acidobacteria bacterium]|nr:LacI family DNA-binding transcriptional regulator [Acidobacteriota bacterium]TDI55533.1 MAG: LacI family transcriptional regulator [Acidobacteriota bacterium]
MSGDPASIAQGWDSRAGGTFQADPATMIAAAVAASHRSGLTILDQPRHDMGRMAAVLILERIGQNHTTARHVVLSPKLVVGESTGPPPP